MDDETTTTNPAQKDSNTGQSEDFELWAIYLFML